jgi:hypothetical protein
MSRNSDLIDTIKMHFARKSSAQLLEIVNTKDHERWSEEAIEAAKQLLDERRAGQAEEPATPEEEAPQALSYESYGLAMGGLAAFGLLTGFIIVPLPRRNYAAGPDPDMPVPFGPDMAWLALDTTDTAGVATALGLRDPRSATWADGINAAHQNSLFVTPPLADWTLVVGNPLLPPQRLREFVKPLLERLSREFGDAQYFCTNQNLEFHVWARARKGRLVRGYGWFGQKSLTLWDEGPETMEERDLGFTVADQLGIRAQQPGESIGASPEESCVMQLAYLWSIDPTTLDAQFKEPVMGLLSGTMSDSSIQRGGDVLYRVS